MLNLFHSADSWKEVKNPKCLYCCVILEAQSRNSRSTIHLIPQLQVSWWGLSRKFQIDDYWFWEKKSKQTANLFFSLKISIPSGNTALTMPVHAVDRTKHPREDLLWSNLKKLHKVVRGWLAKILGFVYCNNCVAEKMIHWSKVFQIVGGSCC